MLGATVPTPRGEEPHVTTHVVDAHVHLNNYHEGQAVPARANCQRLFETMDKHGIDHAVVLTSYKASCDRPKAEEILELLEDQARITVIEGLRWTGQGSTDLYEMETRIEQGLIQGIKLYPGYEEYAINDPSLEAVHRMAAKHDVPILVHTGDTYHPDAKVKNAHPLLMDEVAVDHRDVEYVMCHLGNPWLRDTAEVLYKNENVYADISGLTLSQTDHPFEERIVHEVQDMIAYMGDPGRQLLYGSDWPLAPMGPYLRFLNDLDLDPNEKECVAWKNAARLFDLELA